MKILVTLDRQYLRVNISKIIFKYTVKKTDTKHTAIIATLTHKSIFFTPTLRNITRL